MEKQINTRFFKLVVGRKTYNRWFYALTLCCLAHKE